MNLFSRILIPVGTLGVMVLGAAANGQTTYYAADASVNTTLPGGAVVGYGNQTDLTNRTNPANPTVSFFTGGGVPTSATVDSYNSSTLNLAGGSLGNFVHIFDNGSFNLTSGSIKANLLTYNTSHIAIGGGGIGITLQTHDTSNVAITGGSIGSTSIPSSGIITANSSIVTMSGGTDLGTVKVNDGSTFNLNGGGVTGFLQTTFTGTLNVRGGAPGTFFHAFDSSAINFYGSGLGDTLTTASANGGADSQYALFGTLSDGTSITGESLYLANSGTPTITFNNSGVAATPEPGSLALCIGLASACAFRLRGRRKRTAR